MKHTLALALLSLSALSVEARVVRERPVVKTFTNSAATCAATESCELTEFKLSTYDYNVTFPDGVSYGTGAFISYKTKAIEQLENFAIVQKIRGCQFESKKESDGSVSKRIALVREFFDELVPFKHSQWVIDSVDKDPMYNNYTPANRHGAYRWNRVAGSTDRETEVRYLNGRPARPELYVSDFPGTAFTGHGVAKNISLEFEVCLFATKDVPQSTTPEDVNFAAPIACHSWASSFVYNHSTEKFEKKSELDPFCLD